jgi:hypothetical protein
MHETHHTTSIGGSRLNGEDPTLDVVHRHLADFHQMDLTNLVCNAIAAWKVPNTACCVRSVYSLYCQADVAYSQCGS